MECLVPWKGLTIERWEVAVNEEKDGVLAQTPHWSVRKGFYGGSPVVMYSCRLNPLKRELWMVALDTLQQFVAPFPNPNLVQCLGVVTPSEELESDLSPPNEWVVMEYLPVTLYDVLHHDHISLTRREIALIALQVLQGLLYLHRKQQTLGVCLTSKKVMMDGTNGVKLRRFGLELVLRSGKAPSQLSCPAMKTVYEMPRVTSKFSVECSSPPQSSGLNSRSSSQLGAPTSSTTDTFKDSDFSTTKQDLFAFGVLLLEMCTGEKPTNELFNRISCAKQIDPVFDRILHLTLSLGGVVKLDERRIKSAQITAEELLNLLVVNEQQREMKELRMSSSSFPCFLYADRYFATKEAEQVETKLRERDRRGEIDLKRLAAVEHELLDEQTNFAVLVRQFEQIQREKAQELAEKEQSMTQLKAQEQMQLQSDEEIKKLLVKVQEQDQLILALQASLNNERGRGEVLKLAKVSDAEEKQGLLFDILKLKEEKRKLLTYKQEVDAECAAIARKVGGEKAALEDLEGRLTQAIYRWEEEQRMRRKAERQAEGVSRQQLQMEEERCKYTSVLQQCPIGRIAPNATLPYVLALKDKEVEDLSRQLRNSFDGQTSLRTDIARCEAALTAVSTDNEVLLKQQEEAQNELLSLSSQLQERGNVIVGLEHQLKGADTEIETLKTRIADFEEEMDRQAKMKADEENARKLRHCLTSQCDAPRFLVGASGYCKECEEGATSPLIVEKQQRHRRHRSWDDASIGGIGVRTNVKNIPIMKLVRVLSGSDDTRVENSNQQQLLDALKQLTALLKSDESLKDDLPECLVIKSVLALMYQHKRKLVLQLECCKCLSVVVFSHDRNRLIVVAEGGVEPVLAAMKNFPLEAKVQETSCVLLTNLAHNCDSNRKRILDAGGIDCVIQAMQTFPEQCAVQKRCCWALLTLAGSDVMCDSIAMRGGLGAIMAAMLNCPADEEVQYYGSWALVNLLSGTERLLAFARREGVREVAEAAHACFPGHDGIQEKTLEILQLLG